MKRYTMTYEDIPFAQQQQENKKKRKRRMKPRRVIAISLCEPNLFWEFVGEPVETLVQSGALSGASALNVPLYVPNDERTYRLTFL